MILVVLAGYMRTSESLSKSTSPVSASMSTAVCAYRCVGKSAPGLFSSQSDGAADACGARQANSVSKSKKERDRPATHGKFSFVSGISPAKAPAYGVYYTTCAPPFVQHYEKS